MLAFLAMPIVKWIGGALLIALVVGGGYLWITNAAYNRGHAAGVSETTQHMKNAIAKMKQAAVESAKKWQNAKPDEIDAELKKRCVESCMENPQCVAGCE